MAGPALHVLSSLAKQCDTDKEVRKSDLHLGDWLLVTTANSKYLIRPLRNGYYSVSGGWFDKNELSPFRTRITGCTWGGSAIKLDILAALGRHLEFGNRVVTSTIRGFSIFRCWGKNIAN
jgi:hypothetical protein